MSPLHRPYPYRVRQGFVLLAVLVFVFLLSMVALTVLFRSQGDETAGHALTGGEQAWAAAMSGVQEAMRIAAAIAPGTTDWQDQPGLFRARPVYQDGGEEWFFTVFSAAGSDALVDVRYGLSDEASRLNVNHLGPADLSKLPGLTPALAGTLRQFLGQPPVQTNTWVEPEEGDLPIPEESYGEATNLFVSVPTHRGPLATLDQLLLVPGFTRALLHGAPSSPDDLLSLLPLGSGEGAPASTNPPARPRRNSGLDQYLTVYSRDPNRSAAGMPRCSLNDSNAFLPEAALPPGFSNYLAAARGEKIYFTHPCELLESTIRVKGSQGAEEELPSGITKENLPALLDLFAADKEPAHEGLVNVNTASASVLATLPGIDALLAEAIVSARTGLSPERRATTAWLYQEGVVDAAKFKTIAPTLTARSSQYRFNVIGYGLPSGRYRVLETVIDVGGPAPRVVYLRDITRLGLPIPIKKEDPTQPADTVAALSWSRDETGSGGSRATVRVPATRQTYG